MSELLQYSTRNDPLCSFQNIQVIIVLIFYNKLPLNNYAEKETGTEKNLVRELLDHIFNSLLKGGMTCKKNIIWEGNRGTYFTFLHDQS